MYPISVICCLRVARISSKSAQSLMVCIGVSTSPHGQRRESTNLRSHNLWEKFPCPMKKCTSLCPGRSQVIRTRLRMDGRKTWVIGAASVERHLSSHARTATARTLLIAAACVGHSRRLSVPNLRNPWRRYWYTCRLKVKYRSIGRTPANACSDSVEAVLYAFVSFRRTCLCRVRSRFRFR